MQQSSSKAAWKYFLHGISFSILFLVLGFLWAVLLVLLVLAGAFIGLIIGVVVLFFIIGSLNSFLTNFVWSIPIKTDWKSLLSHGFILFILLLVASIPSMIINLIAPSIVTTIVLFIVYAFIDGFIAKNVAGMWEGEEDEEFEKTKECIKCGKEIPMTSDTCPFCGAIQQ